MSLFLRSKFPLDILYPLSLKNELIISSFHSFNKYLILLYSLMPHVLNASDNSSNLSSAFSYEAVKLNSLYASFKLHAIFSSSLPFSME